ncbi:sulfite exporter TauE/SafE family protein [Nodularia sp. UHCC 0506]|uniref:sulfite exporter TauE/SafE family protein n=1 Tax=Nodularia sp. UHCC 0506 TaxID=3110243 RepID=UPI002B1EB4B1|nr:sulfite exporter TauE/SafE family protein [Nodularia sp. UHCC 0506]MEA5512693.1 sulfite exporter TauE/SafE family protein [Nodularia sp. UHCC 0506]
MNGRILFALFTKIWVSQSFIRVSIIVALTVWTTWLIIVGPSSALSNMIRYWQVAVTMVFGSMIAGGTSMGGGAVAFPVLTKVLQVPAHEARVFSLAIQTVGMGAASLTIVAMGTPLEWRFIRWVSLGGVPGIIISSVFLAPIIPANAIKIGFTIMISSFAIILFFLNRHINQPNLVIQSWGKWERNVSFLVGIIGGMISGLVGSGMDIFAFSVMVLLFGVCEKVSTPNSVILMSINTAVGFFLHKFMLGNFIEPVSNYWLAAVPVVVVGAPLGAILCNLLNRTTVIRVLISLIFVELVSSLLLIPLTLPVIYMAIFALILFLSLFFWMYKIGIQ